MRRERALPRWASSALTTSLSCSVLIAKFFQLRGSAKTGRGSGDMRTAAPPSAASACCATCSSKISPRACRRLRRRPATADSRGASSGGGRARAAPLATTTSVRAGDPARQRILRYGRVPRTLVPASTRSGGQAALAMRGQRSLRFLPTAAALLLREDRALLRAAPAPLPLRAAVRARATHARPGIYSLRRTHGFTVSLVARADGRLVLGSASDSGSGLGLRSRAPAT